MNLPFTLNELTDFARKCRSERLSVKERAWEVEPGHIRYYGAPTLQVIGPDWEHIHDRMWDHSLESVRECAEIAAQTGGVVSLQFPICHMAVGRWESVEVDDGFEIQLYPKFALRTHNTYVDISAEEDAEGGDETETVTT
jgi:hypothetical protein